MIIYVRHKKPAAKPLFYPNDEFTHKFLTACFPARPAKAFSLRQIKMFKQLGIQVVVAEEYERANI